MGDRQLNGVTGRTARLSVELAVIRPKPVPKTAPRPPTLPVAVLSAGRTATRERLVKRLVPLMAAVPFVVVAAACVEP